MFHLTWKLEGAFLSSPIHCSWKCLVHLKFEICFHSRKLSSHPSSLQHKLNFCFHDRIYISNVKCKVLARLGLAPWLPESSSSLSPLYLIFFFMNFVPTTVMKPNLAWWVDPVTCRPRSWSGLGFLLDQLCSWPDGSIHDPANLGETCGIFFLFKTKSSVTFVF